MIITCMQYKMNDYIAQIYKKQPRVEFNRNRLKISKGKSEAVNRRRTDNTGQKKTWKRTNKDLQSTTQKTKH